jgi:hypothetical protein
MRGSPALCYLATVALAGWLSVFTPSVSAAAEAPWCGNTRITAYVRTEFSPWTYDGTSIYTDEPIVAASWDVRLGSIADIEGLGSFRVADRGHLGNGSPTPWVDIAVWHRSEAYALTGYRNVCFRPPPVG